MQNGSGETTGMQEQVLERFREIFGGEDGIRTYFAPGRVNLIGEHTDYNGGHVFPCALTIGTYGAARARKDRKLCFYSLNFPEDGVTESSLDDLKPMEKSGWTDYPKGVIWALGEKGYEIPSGVDFLVGGNIPNGSGLSSSASLEVLTGLVIRDLFGLEELTMTEIALAGQYGENHYNGMNCGIMDQFASAMGKKDCAIFLDTSTLKYEYAPVNLPDARIVITNSKVKHSLVTSAYNERRNECERALKELQEVTDIRSLGELSEEEFEAHKDAVKEEVCRKRARHAVYENQRTIKAVKALRDNNVEEFGRLMNASHVSLRDDYEVSCEEIDILTELAWSIPGVLGSRITGGGFGGCTVSIVKNEAVEEFIRTIGTEYKKKVGHEAEFYVVDLGDGAHRLS